MCCGDNYGVARVYLQGSVCMAYNVLWWWFEGMGTHVGEGKDNTHLV